MVEELRFFLRIGLFTLVISVVYWFVSYDIVGTFLLAFVTIGVALFVIPLAGVTRAGSGRRVAGEGPPVRRALHAAQHAIGFGEGHDPGGGPLEVEEEPLPEASMWPVAAALAALLVGLGLLYGGWFWLPGVAMGAVVAWGWLKQLDG